MSIDSDIALEMILIDLFEFEGVIPFHGPAAACRLADRRAEAFERANANHPKIEFMSFTDDPSCYMMGEHPEEERLSRILGNTQPNMVDPGPSLRKAMREKLR